MKHVRVSVTKEKSLIQREGVLSKDVWCKDEENSVCRSFLERKINAIVITGSDTLITNY